MKRSSVGQISNEQTVGSERPFWLGNPEEDETYISFDPIQSIASLTISESQKGHDDKEDAEGVAISDPPNDEIEILFDTVKIFQVRGIEPVSPFSARGKR